MFVSDDDLFISTGVQALAHAIEHSTGYEGFSAPVLYTIPKKTPQWRVRLI